MQKLQVVGDYLNIVMMIIITINIQFNFSLYYFINFKVHLHNLLMFLWFNLNYCLLQFHYIYYSHYCFFAILDVKFILLIN